MRQTYIIRLLFFGFLLLAYACQPQVSEEELIRPNILIIYLDDLGYGDMSAYGSTEISTPNMDILANEGLRFSNAYATSATCTPSRYGLLTGMYPWRNDNARILSGTAPLLIDTAQMTIPKMLKTKGYNTGIVGKWHLGLGNGNADWNELITPGPNEVGFDYSYIMAATQDRVPTVYIKDGFVVGMDQDDPISVDYYNNFEGEPTGKDNPELLKMMWYDGHNNSIINGISRIGFMKGGEKSKWIDEDMADNFLLEAQQYIRTKSQEKNPFFLYYALQQPHVPRTPHPRFEGKSGMGPRGDVILEADWCIGEIMKTLEEQGVLENTLIIFSSDNGPVLNDGYFDDAVEKLGRHTPWGPFRGGKYSLFEAGTRMPFVSYWKGTIQPGVSEALISQLDLLNSFAALVGSDINTDDSIDMLDVLLGISKDGRKDVILEATSRTALRSGDYIMIPPYNGPKTNVMVNIELGNSSDYQLYNIVKDQGQQINLADQEPKILEQLIARFEELRGISN